MALMLLFLLGSVSGTEDFITSFGGSYIEFGKGITITSDGNYFVAGEFYNADVVLQMYVIMVSATGVKLWDKTFTCATSTYVHSTCANKNGGVLIGAYKYEDCNVANHLHTYIIQLSSSGNLEWEKLFRDEKSMNPHSLILLSDLSYLISGSTQNDTYGSEDGYMMKITSTGTTTWYQKYGSTSTDQLYSTIELSDGSFVSTGQTPVAGVTGTINCFLVKASSSGSLIFSKSYRKYDKEYCQGVAVLLDGTFGLVGTLTSVVSVNGGFDIMFIRVSSDGTQISQHFFGGSNDDTGVRIRAGSDSKFYIAGTTKSLGSGKSDAYLLRVTPEGVVEWSFPFGGAEDEILYDMVLTSDDSMIATGTTETNSNGGSDIYIMAIVLNCPTGKYLNSVTYRCDKCQIGTYNPSPNATSSSACLSCPVGTYQDEVGQAICKKCSPGYYNTKTGSSVSSDCLICTGAWATSNDQGSCLYKGIFATEAAFNADSMSTTCFSSGSIIKPFTTACRTAYRTHCCVGSSLSSTVTCNFGLEISSSDSLYSKYCSACRFMDQTQCPSEGVCWTDSTYTSNSDNPYSGSYSTTCLEAVGPYCSARLRADPTDPQCYMFNSYCGANVSSAAYVANSPVLFLITFTKAISENTINCNTLFEPSNTPNLTTGTISCTRASSTTVQVNVENLGYPLTKFSFASTGLRDICGIYLPSTVNYAITPPNPRLDSISLPTITLTDKCLNLSLSATISKSYTFPLLFRWVIFYTDTSSISSTVLNYISALNSINETSAFLSYEYLISSKTLSIQAKIISPYGDENLSPVTTLAIPEIKDNKKYCGPCQSHNRTLCPILNGICWENSYDFSISSPWYIPSCLHEIAKSCYKAWAANTTSDSQCAEYTGYITYDLMKKKPSVSSIVFTDSLDSVRVTFDMDIRHQEILAISQAFNESTATYFKSDTGLKWISNSAFEAELDPSRGLVTSVTTNANTFYYYYWYSQEPADSATFSLTTPPVPTSLSLKYPDYVSECNNLQVSAVFEVNPPYSMTYKWTVTYNTALSPDSLKAEALEYTNSFASYSNAPILTIPQKYLKQGITITVVVQAKPSSYDLTAVSATATISIQGYKALGEFLYRTRNVHSVEAEGDLPFQISHSTCSKDSRRLLTYGETLSNVTVGFTVYSGSSVGQITTQQTSIESALLAQFNQYSKITVSSSNGFQYGSYYSILITVTDSQAGTSTTSKHIIFFSKPPIQAVITGGNGIVPYSSNIELSASNSIIPYSTGDTISYQWEFQNCFSLISNAVCECPYVNVLYFNQSTFVITQNKTSVLAMYEIKLIVKAESGAINRISTAYTSVIPYSASIVSASSQSAFGHNPSLRDFYLTLSFSDSVDLSKLSISWDLIGVKQLYPYSTVDYDKKIYYLNSIFSSRSLYSHTIVEPTLSDYYRPTNLSHSYKTTNRTLGFPAMSDQRGSGALFPYFRYEYAASIINSASNTLGILFVNFETGKDLPNRTISVYPSSGTGFITEFSIQNVPLLSTDKDPSHYFIYRKDCPSSNTAQKTLISQKLLDVEQYKLQLAPGLQECSYQVEITVRIVNSVTEQYKDFSQIITVTSSSAATTETILNSEVNRVQNYVLDLNSKLTALSQYAVAGLTENSTTAFSIARGIIDVLSTYSTNQNNPTIVQSETFRVLLEKLKTVLASWQLESILETIKTMSSKCYNDASLAKNNFLLLHQLSKTATANTSFQNEISSVEKEVTQNISNLRPIESSLYLLANDLAFLGIAKLDFSINQAKNYELNLGDRCFSFATSNTQSAESSSSLTAVVQSFNYNPLPIVKSNTIIYSEHLYGSSSEIVSRYKDFAADSFSENMNKTDPASPIFQFWNLPTLLTSGGSHNVSISLAKTISGISETVNNNLIPLTYSSGYWTNINATSLTAGSSSVTGSFVLLSYNCGNSMFCAMMDFTYYSTLINTDRNLTVLILLIALVFVLLIGLILAYLKDKYDLYESTLQALEYKYHSTVINKGKVGDSKISEIIHMYSRVCTLGFRQLALSIQQVVHPGATNQEWNEPPAVEESNGFTSFTSLESQNLRLKFLDLQESRVWLSSSEIYSSMFDDVTQDEILLRLSQDNIDRERLRDKMTFFDWIFMEHVFFTMFVNIGEKLPRRYRYFIFIITMVAELFLAAIFAKTFDDTVIENFDYWQISNVGYGCLIALIAIPIKIILRYLFRNTEIVEKMSRKDIESIESCNRKKRLIGFIAACILFLGFTALVFNEWLGYYYEKCYKWIVLFAFAFVFELIILAIFWIIMKLLLGLALISLLRSSVVLCTGACFINFMAEMIALN